VCFQFTVAPEGEVVVASQLDRVKPRSRKAEIRWAFDEKADADRLAYALDARVSGQYGGWLSCRSFRLNETIERAVETALAD
jgi:hypothetical protein